MTEQIRGLTGEQIRALEMLAGYPDGCTQAVLKANGFIGVLGKVIRAGFATATPRIVEAAAGWCVRAFSMEHDPIGKNAGLVSATLRLPAYDDRRDIPSEIPLCVSSTSASKAPC
jgi:hypothetical protein